MTDLERFFRRLVVTLAATDPARLHQPLPLEAIHESIIPYRSHRRALGLESSEDYELVLLRLCAGEGGLARTEPEEVRARFAEELRNPSPDLAVLHQYENVLVSLRSAPLAQALEQAQEGLMDDPRTSHPFYWAAFIILGDGAKPLIPTTAIASAEVRPAGR